MPYKIPFPNFLANVLHPTGSTIDLLEADENLFSNMVLPDGVDRDLVIETILEKYGMQALVRPDPSYMKKHIGVWSRRKLWTWTKLYNTLNLEYNPIDNTDKYEDYTDTRTTERKTAGETASTSGGTDSRTENETTRGTRNEAVDHDVSAENASAYQPDSRDTTQGSNSDSRENTASGTTSLKSSGTNSETENYTDTFKHTLHTHGNIGVTTTQQMLEAERESVRYNLVEEIAADYQAAFCLDIY